MKRRKHDEFGYWDNVYKLYTYSTSTIDVNFLALPLSYSNFLCPYFSMNTEPFCCSLWLSHLCTSTCMHTRIGRRNLHFRLLYQEGWPCVEVADVALFSASSLTCGRSLPKLPVYWGISSDIFHFLVPRSCWLWPAAGPAGPLEKGSGERPLKFCALEGSSRPSGCSFVYFTGPR